MRLAYAKKSYDSVFYRHSPPFCNVHLGRIISPAYLSVLLGCYAKNLTCCVLGFSYLVSLCRADSVSLPLSIGPAVPIATFASDVHGRKHKEN